MCQANARFNWYLWAFVVNSDLVVFVRVFAGQQCLQRLVDLDKEAARLQGDLICCASATRCDITRLEAAGVPWLMRRPWDTPSEIGALRPERSTLCAPSARARQNKQAIGTHSRVSPGASVLARVALAVIDLGMRVWIENSRGSAGFRILRAHATGDDRPG